MQILRNKLKSDFTDAFQKLLQIKFIIPINTFQHHNIQGMNSNLSRSSLAMFSLREKQFALHADHHAN